MGFDSPFKYSVVQDCPITGRSFYGMERQMESHYFLLVLLGSVTFSFLTFLDVLMFILRHAFFPFSWNFSELNVLTFQRVGELNRSLKLASTLWSAYLYSCVACISELLSKSQWLCSLQVLILNLSVQALSDRKTKYFYNSESYWPNWEKKVFS